MEWNAKLDWAEEIYTMLIVLPVPVILAGILWYIAPLLHRRRMRALQQPVHDDSINVSGKLADEST